jgi:hypothetical protein
MKIILAALLFMIIFFSIGKIGYIIKFVNTYVIKDINIFAFMWFFSILIINLLIISYTIGYYYYIKKNSIGPPGPNGYPGLSGIDTECIICDTQK